MTGNDSEHRNRGEHLSREVERTRKDAVVAFRAYLGARMNVFIHRGGPLDEIEFLGARSRRCEEIVINLGMRTWRDKLGVSP
jgi:hypothetical protein